MASVEAPVAAKAAWEDWVLDMGGEVAAFDPHAEPDWRLKPIVIPGTLAVIAGQGGGGKTWLMHEAANAVQRGINAAGMVGKPGRAMIVDAEMGRWLTVQRFAQQGYSTDITVVEVAGKVNLTKPEQRQLLYEAIIALEPDFIGFDSLARLTAGADENGKDIADFVDWIRKVCLDHEIAGMLLHHAGWEAERTRGSSAIRDSCDTVWYMRAVDDGEIPADESRVREVTCRGVALKGPRWAAPPKPLFMRLRDSGGLELADKPATRKEAVQDTKLDRLREAVVSGLVRSKMDAARVVDATTPATGQQWLKKLGAIYEPDSNGGAGVYVMNGNGDHPAI